MAHRPELVLATAKLVIPKCHLEHQKGVCTEWMWLKESRRQPVPIQPLGGMRPVRLACLLLPDLSVPWKHQHVTLA